MPQPGSGYLFVLILITVVVAILTDKCGATNQLGPKCFGLAVINLACLREILGESEFVVLCFTNHCYMAYQLCHFLN